MHRPEVEAGGMTLLHDNGNALDASMKRESREDRIGTRQQTEGMAN